MGYALVIKNANYGVNRVAQVTLNPGAIGKNDTITSVNFTYGSLDKDNNTISLSSITLNPLTTTAKYTFVLDQSVPGVSINPISGKITLSSQYNNQSIKVNVVSSNNVVGTTTVDPDGYDAPVTYTYSDLAITKFQYTKTIAAAGGNTGSPTLQYSYKINGSDGSSSTSSMNASVKYEFVGTHTGASISTLGVVTFGANSETTEREYSVKVTVTCPDKTTTVSQTITVKQSGKEVTPPASATLTSITVTYNGSPKIIGSNLLISDITVTGHYSDNSEKDLTSASGVTFSTTIIGSVGENTITVSYNDFSYDLTVVGLDYITGVEYLAPEKINDVITSVPVIVTASNENYNSLSEYNSAPNVVTYNITITSTGNQNVSEASSLSTTTGQVTYDLNKYLTNFTGTSQVNTTYSMKYVPVTNTSEVSYLVVEYQMSNNEILLDITPSTIFTAFAGVSSVAPNGELGGSTSDPRQIYYRTSCGGCVSTQCNAGDVIYIETTEVSYDVHRWIWETSQPIVNASGFITSNLTASSSNRYTLKNSSDIGTHLESRKSVYKVQNDNYYITVASFRSQGAVIGKI